KLRRLHRELHLHAAVLRVAEPGERAIAQPLARFGLDGVVAQHDLERGRLHRPLRATGFTLAGLILRTRAAALGNDHGTRRRQDLADRIVLGRGEGVAPGLLGDTGPAARQDVGAGAIEHGRTRADART